MIGAVGRDPFADEALACSSRAESTSHASRPRAPTGVALIVVAEDGENQIVVAPGANGGRGRGGVGEADAVLCQLEIPVETVIGRGRARRFLVPERRAREALPTGAPRAVDLLVVNRYELEAVGRSTA